MIGRVVHYIPDERRECAAAVIVDDSGLGRVTLAVFGRKEDAWARVDAVQHDQEGRRPKTWHGPGECRHP